MAADAAWVEATLLSDGADLLVHVADSGDGVPAGIASSVFDHGFTTRDGDAPGHGIGLALARHTARSHGGDIHPEGSPGRALRPW